MNSLQLYEHSRVAYIVFFKIYFLMVKFLGQFFINMNIFKNNDAEFDILQSTFLKFLTVTGKAWKVEITRTMFNLHLYCFSYLHWTTSVFSEPSSSAYVICNKYRFLPHVVLSETNGIVHSIHGPVFGLSKIVSPFVAITALLENDCFNQLLWITVLKCWVAYTPGPSSLYTQNRPAALYWLNTFPDLFLELRLM